MTPEQLAEIEARAGSVKTWKPVHSAEPIPQICDVDVPALVAEVKRLTAERDSLKGLLSGSQTELRDAVAAWGKAERERDEALDIIDRVRALHRGLRIYDECGHKHDASDPGVKFIDEVGFVCEDGYMYTICAECCRDGDYQSEHCANDHSHTVCHPCPTHAILDGGGT